ncbi:MAG TPA: AhpC/TSA family protein [Candidatus Dormibacteraeota bacterium]|nr:AhpC/TSA family protein [Candidatus Dormibacteraeota bacterium]
MRGEQPGIEAAGARLVFVGNGTTAQARDFRDRHAPGAAIFTDPSAYTYRAIGARAGAASTVGGMVLHGPRALRQGHVQTSIRGRPFQHGGVLIALPGDVLAYSYISTVAGDHPAPAEIHAALRAVRDRMLASRADPRAAWAERAAAWARGSEAGEQAPVEPPPLPGWPGAPPGAPPPIRQPRWSFDVPTPGPPRSAAG